MRRLFVLALVALFILPAAVFAQDSKSLWDLSSVFTVTDVGFQFNYPADWVYSSDAGIYLADTQANLTAMTDSDPKTASDGYTITVGGVSLETLGLKADAKLDNVVQTIVEQAGITEQDRAEVPVMSRRSISIIGTNKEGKPGIATIWLQDGVIVLMGLGAPEMSGDVAYSWGQILSTIRPLNALEFSDATLTSPDGDFTIAYPKDWFASEEQGGVAELEEDLAKINSPDSPKGAVVVLLEPKLSVFGKDVTDLESLSAVMKAGQGWDDTVIPSEHIILGQPALTYMGETKALKDFTAIFTLLIQDDKAIVIAAAVPAKTDMTEFMPTYLAMLGSITAVEASK